MNISQALKISSSGLSAERLRMDVISANIANANSVESYEGGPYQRQVAVLAPVHNEKLSFKEILSKSRVAVKKMEGVRVKAVIPDETPGKMVYDPQHPYANADGFVEYPNVDVLKEMVELITASRAYEANVTAVNAAKNMILKTLEIGR